ncbi:MAG: TIGR04551 family protein [Myxococcales bacterium]|nr:TIGR04551 family protein [Myxococcales bacterium]MCB9541078.1 TIGR04551 family protein [Myxococcales bacterium]
MKRAVTILALALAAQPAMAQPRNEGAEAAGGAEAAEQPAPKRAVPKSKASAADQPAAAADEEAEEAEPDAAEPAAAAPAAAPTADRPVADRPVADRPVATPGASPAPPADDAFSDLPSFQDLDSGAVVGDMGQDLQANWDAAADPTAKVAFPWVEHHGYFRTRADLFYNLDLDTYDRDTGQRSSGILPPLTELDQTGAQHPETPEDDTFRQGAESLAGVNLRFRYAPTLHISESLRVRTTLDILDNVVFGSTPDGGPRSSTFSRPDVELEFFSQSQRSPSAGVDSWRDAIRVKHVWGEWNAPLGLVAAGRMPAHWGLGMLQNGGECLDCDFGDSIDRVMGMTQLFGTYIAASWDFPAEGAIGMPGVGTVRSETGGQPYDLDQRDDVNQWTVSIFKKPYSLQEKEQRARELAELGSPIFDWGVHGIIRNQSLETTYSGGLPAEDEGAFQLREIDAFTVTPDLWLDFQYRPSATTGVRIQFEGAVVFGDIQEVPQQFSQPSERCADPSETDPTDCQSRLLTPRTRDILQYGYALEIDARYASLNYGLHQGLASGDDQEGFGYLDRTRLDETDLETYDDTLSLFRFDRDYHVDLILFREILGGVSNAAYFKPYIGYDLVDETDEAWGFQLSAMYAFALDAGATTGNDAGLGLEFDLEVYIHEFDRFRWSLAYGMLYPFSGMDVRVDTPGVTGERTTRVLDAGVAHTLQMFLGMEF